MKTKAHEMCVLFDYYGDLLTEKQKDIFDYYYNEDLSLAEISEILGITRQGVRDAVVRSEETLLAYEERLGFIARFGELEPKISKISDLADEILAINNRTYFSAEIDQKANEIFSTALTIIG